MEQRQTLHWAVCSGSRCVENEKLYRSAWNGVHVKACQTRTQSRKNLYFDQDQNVRSCFTHTEHELRLLLERETVFRPKHVLGSVEKISSHHNFWECKYVLKRISPMKDRADMMWRWWSGPDCKVWCKAVGGNVSGWTPPSFGTAPTGGTQAPIQDHISSMEPIIGPECFLAYHCHVGTFLLPENIWPIIYHRSEIHFWWQTCAQTICHLTTVKSDVWGVLESMEGKVASQRTSFFHHQLVRHVAKLRREEEWKTILLANTRIWVHTLLQIWGRNPDSRLQRVSSCQLSEVQTWQKCARLWTSAGHFAQSCTTTVHCHYIWWGGFFAQAGRQLWDQLPSPTGTHSHS